MATVTIRIPGPLRAFCGGVSAEEVHADTVGDALEALGAQHSDILQRIFTPEQELRPFVNVFLDKKNVRSLKGMATPLTEHSTVSIVPAIAGG